MKRFERVAALALVSALAGGARAAGEPTPLREVGVLEKLDAQVPLDLELKDEAGQPVTLGALIDRPTILTLNYFRCAGICTPQLNNVADLLNQLPLDPARDFRVVTVSFDERDTPEIAAQKRANYLRLINRPFPPDSWRFLTGDAATTRSLADSVGYLFRPQGEDFVHPGVLMVLSPQGRVMRYLYGIRYLPADVEMAIADARRGQSRPAIAKLASICFTYDPVSRRYVVDVTRLAGLLTLLGLGVFVALFVIRRRPRAAPSTPGGPPPGPPPGSEGHHGLGGRS